MDLHTLQYKLLKEIGKKNRPHKSEHVLEIHNTKYGCLFIH